MARLTNVAALNTIGLVNLAMFHHRRVVKPVINLKVVDPVFAGHF